MMYVRHFMSSLLALSFTVAFCVNFWFLNFVYAYQTPLQATRFKQRIRTKFPFASSVSNELSAVNKHNVFFFPGQGAQYEGMALPTAEEIPSAKQLYHKASEILGYDLLETCTKGKKSVLSQTNICQPAIFVCSMAAVERLRAQEGNDEVNSAAFALGLSLGEYSALCYAGAISFEDGVRVTKARGEAMQEAAQQSHGGMVSVIGLKESQVAELCDRVSLLSGEKIRIANYLCNGNLSVSGGIKACELLEKMAVSEYKALKAIRLAVAGAFHTSYMLPAIPKLREALERIEIKPPRIPVIFNVDAEPHSEVSEIRDLLSRQVVNPVLWESSVKRAIDGSFHKGYELGPGKVISGILKRIDRSKHLEHVV